MRALRVVDVAVRRRELRVDARAGEGGLRVLGGELAARVEPDDAHGAPLWAAWRRAARRRRAARCNVRSKIRWRRNAIATSWPRMPPSIARSLTQGTWPLSVRMKSCQAAASAAASPHGWNFTPFRHERSYLCARSGFGTGGRILLSWALTSMVPVWAMMPG